MSTMTRTRLTAAERTEQLVCAAITAFSSAGYAGTSTDDIARLAGVSQPYVIRLFGSKQRLFLAGFEHAASQIEQAFRDSGATDLEDLGAEYRTLLDRRELLGMMLHGFAASADPAVGDVVRARFGAIYELVREQTGAEPTEATEFVATGMLLTVLSAMRVVGPDPVAPVPWMTEMTGVYPKLCGSQPG
jgi:AcrR family transcriptional regulator